jgi:hypothetical protein
MLERHRYNALQIGVVEWFVDIGDCAKLKDLAGALGVGIPTSSSSRPASWLDKVASTQA